MVYKKAKSFNYGIDIDATQTLGRIVKEINLYIGDVSDSLMKQASATGINRYVVGCIVKRGNGEILLLKRASGDFMGGIYELPSGKVEAGESLDVALRREVLEETALKVTDIGRHIGYFDYDSSSGKKSRQFNFLVSVDGDKVRISKEHEAYAWVNKNTIKDYPVTDSVMKLVVATLKSKTTL